MRRCTVPEVSSRRPALAATALLAALAIGCSDSSTAVTDTTSSTTSLAQYFISPVRCSDNSGPDCTRLRLGDADLSTTTAGIGKLFSCAAGNPNAGGSNKARITWINTSASTWNLMAKPFLPASTAAGAAGTITVTDANGTRTIQSTNVPVDAKIGDWPMTKYALLTAIDGNPGIPAARAVSYALSSTPTVNATPTCVSLGAIGVTLNGVVLYNSVDGRGNDAAANEILDIYGGHPANTDYHYHSVPERFDVTLGPDGHSGIVGYIRDGFAIYGYRGVGGAEITNADLDVCHGHAHGTIGYHYHATMEYPYTIGCYRGTPR